jgi:hypothetical protein
LTIGYRWPGVGEPGRSAKERPIDRASEAIIFDA